MPLLETPGHSRASLGQSLVGSLLLFPGSWCTQGSVYALQEPISQSCVSSGSSVVELMATSPKRAYTYPSLLHPEPLSCGSLLLTRTSTGDAKTQFCFSLCGDPGSWYAQGLFQPCERLWKKWGWILNAISPLLVEASPLPLDVGYIFLVGSNILLREGNGNLLQYSGMENSMD